MVILPANNTGTGWMLFVTGLLPYLTVFGLCWKAIDKVFEYLGKRLKEVILEVVKGYIAPLLDMFEGRFDGIKKEHTEIKKLLEDLNKKQ